VNNSPAIGEVLNSFPAEGTEDLVDSKIILPDITAVYPITTGLLTIGMHIAVTDAPGDNRAKEGVFG
jgi:hypothetical protein